jgi:hypothetical protein
MNSSRLLPEATAAVKPRLGRKGIPSGQLWTPNRPKPSRPGSGPGRGTMMPAGALDDLRAVPRELLAELKRQASERLGRNCPEDWPESAECVQAIPYAWLGQRQREDHARNGRPAKT